VGQTIYLSFWFLFSGKLVKTDRYINVDEGQDIATSEYNVLNQVNGGRVVFNIYGDTNQLIKTGRGIHDWSHLLGVITADVFVLNENYRNTRQITNYCNEKLNFNSISIGLAGEEVRHIQQTEAILELNKYQNTKTKKRIAIIVNNLYSPVAAMFMDIEGFSHNCIKEGRVSILTVDHAKGLEFETVYVVPDGMSKNEKYIAFTRALSELIIVEEGYHS
jgi:superfamily I DNA/RNA helicase